MGEAAKKESSMEDILASIRRIIHSETGSSPQTTAPAEIESSKMDSTITTPRVETAPTASYRSNSLAELVQMNKSAAPVAMSPSERSVSENASNSLAALKESVLRETLAEPVKQPVQSPANAVGLEKKDINSAKSPIAENSIDQKIASRPTSGLTFQQIADAAARAAGNEPSQLRKMMDVPAPKASEEAREMPRPNSTPVVANHDVEAKMQKAEASASPLAVKAAPSSFAKLAEAVKAETISPVPATLILTPRSEPVVQRSQEPLAEPKAENIVAEFKEALVAPSTSEAVNASISRLRKGVADIDSAQVESVLRPMLKEWLDNNLPNLVEKLVRQEIDRISSGS